MSRNILTEPLHVLEASTKKLSVKKIVSLLKAIYDHKWTNLRNTKNNEMVLDIERRETILEGELIRRGELTVHNRAEFRKMLRANYKRRIY